jgi:hypothetical protein
LLPELHPIPLAAVVLGSYGVAYFGVTYILGMSEARTVIGKTRRFLRFKK